MHSQISDIQKTGCVESQTMPSSVVTNNNNNIASSKSTTTTANSQSAAIITKRKQNSVHQTKSSSTTDLTVVMDLQKTIATSATKSISSTPASKHVPHTAKATFQQMPRQMPNQRATLPRTNNNGRNDDHRVNYHQMFHIYDPSASAISSSMSSPQIGTQHSIPFHNKGYNGYQQMQAQQPLSQPNRQNYSNNSYNNNGKKVYYPRSKRHSGNSSSSSEKMYSFNNNNQNHINRNDNNNEYERNGTNKSGSQQVSRNGNRPYNSVTNWKNNSRYHYSSSSSSSSSSSLPMTKKSIHRLHSPSSSPHLIASLSFQGDSCTTPMAYQDVYYINPQWSPYGEDCQNQNFSYDWPRNQVWEMARSIPHQQHIVYTDSSTGEVMTVTNQVDGRGNLRVNKANRGNPKNAPSTIKLYTPPDRFMNRAPFVEVKEPPQDLTNGSKWDRLSLQVWHKFLVSQQKEGTYTKKIKMWKNMYSTVLESFSDYSMFMVGSTISGFGTDFSDVDMCLLHSAKNGPIYVGNDLRVHSMDILREFEELLKRNPAIYGEFNLIPAKVPILRFKDTFHEFEIDLNYNNYVGVQNTRLMYCYGRMDWRVRPLALVVKLWAQYHGINNAKEMTISSYSLVLMVIHFLQCAVTPAVLPCLHDLYPNKFQKPQEIKSIDMHEDLAPKYSDNKQTLGELFFQFLHYYTNFDFKTKAISVRKGCTIPIEVCRSNNSPKNDPNQWKELCIEEPFDFTNTAHSCYDSHKFEWIRRVFLISYETIVNTRDLKNILPTDEDLS